MDGLISRAAAIGCLGNSPEQMCMPWSEVERMLRELPAVDAVPVVHARWTTKRTWKHDGEWYCSACEYEPVVFMDSAFCPNCGAKMNGESDG